MIMSKNLGAVIDKERSLEKVAIIDFDGSATREVTYGALDALANGVARALAKRGYQRGDRIALLAANSSDWLASHLGIMRAGLVSVPINYRLPTGLVQYIIGDCAARLVLCDAERAAVVPEGVETIDLASPAFASFVDHGDFDIVEPQEREASTIMYTSGSTGRPKGVILSHDAQRWVVETRLASRDIEHDRALIAAPLYHLNALALSHLIFSGHSSMVMMPQFKVKPYVEAVSRFKCNWLTSVPPMIAMMLDDKEAMAKADFSSVEHLRMGSAPVNEVLLAEIARVMPNAHVVNAYGTTEGGPVVFAPHPDGKPSPHLSLGCAHPGLELRIVDADGKETDEGVLQIRSPGMMNGYHNRPDLPVPFTEDAYYNTGDVFRRDSDGFHYFIGRCDDMFVSGGENIFPGEVERMLEGHPDVMQACVVAVDDRIKGKKPVAFVQLSPGAELDADGIKAYALQNGAAYQHPRAIWLVEEFPLASTNKIDRGLLAERARQQLGIAG
jgi:acyl-CoA synthetase (AMP-forming)/AMP-acid ligase II